MKLYSFTTQPVDVRVFPCRSGVGHHLTGAPGEVGCHGQLELPVLDHVRGLPDVAASVCVCDVLDDWTVWGSGVALHLAIGTVRHLTFEMKQRQLPIANTTSLQSVVHRFLPALVMGSIAIVAGLLGFFLPETRGKKLQDGFETAQRPKSV